MMEPNNEVLVLSDNDCDSDWEGVIPKIVSTKSLSSSGSESAFSGFSIRAETLASRRLYEDLEIVEEVIRDVLPGKVDRRLRVGQPVPYRERKMGFQWLKVKKENTSPTSELYGESPLLDLENSSDDTSTSNLNGICSTPKSKRRSFAAMRPSVPTSDQKLEKRRRLYSSQTEEQTEEQPPPSPMDLDVTTLYDSDDADQNKDQNEQTSNENKRLRLRSSRTEKHPPLHSSQTEEQPPPSPIDLDVTTLYDSDDADQNKDQNEQTSKKNGDKESNGKEKHENSKGTHKELSTDIIDKDDSFSERSAKSDECGGKSQKKYMESHLDELYKAKEDLDKENFKETSCLDSNENSQKKRLTRSKVLKVNLEDCRELVAKINRESHSDESSKDKEESNKDQSQENSNADSNENPMKKKLRKFAWKEKLESDSSSGRSTPSKSDECEEEAKDNRESHSDESSKDKEDSNKDQSQENSNADSNENPLKKKLKKCAWKENLESDSSSGRSTPSKPDECEEEAKVNVSELRQSKRSSNEICNTDYGRLVWGKTGSSRPWPAVIVNYEHCGESKPPIDQAWLLWFGDYRITQVPLSKVTDFVKHFKSTFVSSYDASYNVAIFESLKECREQSGLGAFPDKKGYVRWGVNGLTGFNNKVTGKGGCSPNVARCLSRIRKMRSRENFSSSEASFFPTSTSEGDDSCAEARKSWKPKAALIKAVRDGTQDVEKICIACNRIDCEVVAPHTYFHGGTCSACKDELDDLSGFAPDGTSRYCLICGSPGELIICDGDECGKVFCSGCIELLVSPKALQDIMDTDPWLCFICAPYSVETHGLLKPRPDWQEKIATQPKDSQVQIPEVEDETPDISKFPRKPLRVLSLFDGIATGLFVLDKLGFDIEVYYAAEINDPAKNVASINFGSRVVNIGDVQAVTDKKIAEMCPIDLLIGGSPCNDLSFVNPNRKGLFDPTGTGILFFHYFRALKTILLHNKDTHLFWLFENVNHMPREFKIHINTFLDREPVVIDAKYFSPQSRPRCFWGNIPGMYKPLPEEMLKRAFPLDKYVAKVKNRACLAQKVNCITTNPNSLKPVFKMNDYADFPWITEIEKIFGFPPHYTDVGNLSIRQRQALLGRSWSVGVVEYILRPLTRYFPLRQNRRKENADSPNEVSRTNIELEVDGNEDVIDRNSVIQTSVGDLSTENMEVLKENLQIGIENNVNCESGVFSRHRRIRASDMPGIDQNSESETERSTAKRKDDVNNLKERKLRLSRRNVRLNQRHLLYWDDNRHSVFNHNKQTFFDIPSLDSEISSACKGLPQFMEDSDSGESFSGFSSFVVVRDELQCFDNAGNDTDPLGSPRRSLSDSDNEENEVGIPTAEREESLLVNPKLDTNDSSSHNAKISCNVDSIAVDEQDFPSEEWITDSFSDCSLGMFISLENNAYEGDLSEFSANDPLSDNNL